MASLRCGIRLLETGPMEGHLATALWTGRRLLAPISGKDQDWPSRPPQAASNASFRLVTCIPPWRVSPFAALGDFTLAQAWLRGNTARGVQLINDAGTPRWLHLALKYFPRVEAQNDGELRPTGEAPDLYQPLYRRTLSRKSVTRSYRARDSRAITSIPAPLRLSKATCV